MYNVDVSICSIGDLDNAHTEHVKFYSKYTARRWVRDVIKCVDVEHVMIVDSETGEIILELDDRLGIVWDAEG